MHFNVKVMTVFIKLLVSSFYERHGCSSFYEGLIYGFIIVQVIIDKVVPLSENLHF